ncbi:MAG: sigma-70 family RNA polymerase sigma factor [Candidatus Paceibacterota bacterium]|jgi:RNA polymerase sigma-70 factor (ECF subfamily)
MLDGLSKKENEKDLAERAIMGEAPAFGLLYDRYQPGIFRFIYLKVGHREEAEDLTHQVFLSAWQNINSFKDQGLPISSWLYRIARNKVIDHYRTKKNLIDIEKVTEEVVVEEKAGEETIKKMEIEVVYQSLSKLTPDQQEIIILRFVEELSYEEISKIIGKNQGAIRVLQFRAIRKLKKMIGKKENNQDNQWKPKD